MSAWLVFAMLGFYPLQPFSPHYVTGRPMVDADIELPQGRMLRIRGRGPVPQWQGRQWPTTDMPHAAWVQGGELRFAELQRESP